MVNKIEFGDFQTPEPLARQVCSLLLRLGVRPRTVIEPSCGVGNFLVAADEAFPDADLLALDINPAHVREAQARSSRARISVGDFFQLDWSQLLDGLEGPFLCVGNPPWVTNARVGSLGGSNLPEKMNFQGISGMDALTGKSNFDISEWMLLRALDSLRGHESILAVLCKTAVARKVLAHGWKHDFPFDTCQLRTIDALEQFGAAVDACLLICSFAASPPSHECSVFPDLEGDRPIGTFGYRDSGLIADVVYYDRWKHLGGGEPAAWRSGIKHDCSPILELKRDENGYVNGKGERVDLEEEYLFPLLKSSDLAHGRRPRRFLVVTQRRIGEDTSALRVRAPKLWEYLEKNAALLEKRASSIYKKRPRFSIFGVGDYSFSPWKVGISGFYKKLQFEVIGPFEGKPAVLDDTCYFLPCESEADARLLGSMLNSEPARRFYESFVFWDAKRPITAELLRRLNLPKLSNALGVVESSKPLPGPPLTSPAAGGRSPGCRSSP